ncbi:hypothetical protein SUGI_0631440 [Cryptomeria japonica]|nr:hypothetical protein SUGI_0631440 [Cryptomeria japonica]
MVCSTNREMGKKRLPTRSPALLKKKKASFSSEFITAAFQKFSLQSDEEDSNKTSHGLKEEEMGNKQSLVLVESSNMVCLRMGKKRVLRIHFQNRGNNRVRIHFQKRRRSPGLLKKASYCCKTVDSELITSAFQNLKLSGESLESPNSNSNSMRTSDSHHNLQLVHGLKEDDQQISDNCSLSAALHHSKESQAHGNRIFNLHIQGMKIKYSLHNAF